MQSVITDKKNRPGIIVLILLLVFGLIGVFETYYVKKNGVYVLATILYVKHAPRGGYEATIEYTYMDQSYQKVVSFSENVVNRESVGKRIIFSLIPGHPSMIAFKDYAPKCLGDNPPEGWSEIPKCE